MRGGWTTLGSRIAYKNPWLTVREDRVIRPDGARSLYSVLDTKGSVLVAALSPENKVCFVRQYRYPTRVFSWELPGGNSTGERPLSAAKRELQEETGLVARRWVLAGKFLTYSGVANEWCRVFIAHGLLQTGHDTRAEDGITALRWVSLHHAIRLSARGTITDGASIAALTVVALKLNALR